MKKNIKKFIIWICKKFSRDEIMQENNLDNFNVFIRLLQKGLFARSSTSNFPQISIERLK